MKIKKQICFLFVLFIVVAVSGQNCIKKTKVNKCFDTIINKEEFFKLQKKCSVLQEDTSIIRKQIDSLENRLEQLKIDEFLNLQDTSIFGSRFMSIDTNSIPKRSRAFYNLIKQIRDLNSVLNRKHKDAGIQELINEAGKTVEKAISIIDEINTGITPDLFSCLSDSQVTYYRRLIEQYNELVMDLK